MFLCCENEGVIFKWSWINTLEVCNVMHSPSCCVSIWPTSWAPGGFWKKLQSFLVTSSKSPRKQKWDFEQTYSMFCFFIYLFIFETQTFNFIFHVQKKKTLAPKIHSICLPDTNQKVKICIIDDRDAVNLLAHIFWAHTEHINILGPLRHTGRRAELSDTPACRSHLHWRRREPQSIPLSFHEEPLNNCQVMW